MSAFQVHLSVQYSIVRVHNHLQSMYWGHGRGWQYGEYSVCTSVMGTVCMLESNQDVMSDLYSCFLPRVFCYKELQNNHTKLSFYLASELITESISELSHFETFVPKTLYQPYEY